MNTNTTGELKEQLNDIAGQIDFKPEDLNSKARPGMKDFTRSTRRMEIYQKAEDHCMTQYPGIQVSEFKKN